MTSNLVRSHSKGSELSGLRISFSSNSASDLDDVGGFVFGGFVKVDDHPGQAVCTGDGLPFLEPLKNFWK